LLVVAVGQWLLGGCDADEVKTQLNPALLDHLGELLGSQVRQGTSPEVIVALAVEFELTDGNLSRQDLCATMLRW
jgi:hypothetical protein